MTGYTVITESGQIIVGVWDRLASPNRARRAVPLHQGCDV